MHNPSTRDTLRVCCLHGCLGLIRWMTQDLQRESKSLKRRSSDATVRLLWDVYADGPGSILGTHWVFHRTSVQNLWSRTLQPSHTRSLLKEMQMDTEMPKGLDLLQRRPFPTSPFKDRYRSTISWGNTGDLIVSPSSAIWAGLVQPELSLWKVPRGDSVSRDPSFCSFACWLWTPGPGTLYITWNHGPYNLCERGWQGRMVILAMLIFRGVFGCIQFQFQQISTNWRSITFAIVAYCLLHWRLKDEVDLGPGGVT